MHLTVVRSAIATKDFRFFRFAILASIHLRGTASAGAVLFVLSIPNDSGSPGKEAISASSGHGKTRKRLTSLHAISNIPLRPPSFLHPAWFPFPASPYPDGTGRASIRRTMHATAA